MVKKKVKLITSNIDVLKWMKNEERKLKLKDIKTYKNFFENIKKQSKTLKNLLINLKKNKKKVVGYGASTKGNVILQYAKINENLLPLILDVNKFKFGRFTPGTQIKIVDEKYLKKIKKTPEQSLGFFSNKNNKYLIF